MKTKHIFLIGLVVAFSSCSTAYRTGQTPDDVYYSPAPAQNTYVVTENQDERNSYRYRNQEEQDIRRGISDSRYRSNVSISLGSGYSPYNNYGYNAYSYNPYNSLSPYSYGYNPMYDPYRFDPFFNPYTYNTYYNPYSYSKYGGNYYTGYYPSYPPVVIVPSKINTNKGPRKYNLGSYNTPSSNNNARTVNGYKPGTQAPAPSPVRTFKKTNEKAGTGVGNVIRRVFTPSEDNSRSYTPSNNGNRNNTPASDNNSRPANNPPARTFSNPPATNSNPPASTAPVRTFRKN